MFYTYANMSNTFSLNCTDFQQLCILSAACQGVSCGSDGCSRRPCTKPSACGEDTFLKRVQLGGVRLDESLAPGEFRELTEEELGALRPPDGL